MDLIDPEVEFSALNLGDERLDRRARRCLRHLDAAPNHSFPVALADKADLEAFYRLVNNEVVDLEDLLAPHRECSWRRGRAGRPGLVLHDTTELSFPGETPREGLHWTGHRSVMHAHISLLVGLEEAPEVHGVVGFRAYAVTAGQWHEALPGRTTRTLEVGSDRWRDAVVGARATAPDGLRLLHVMDREADDYPLWCTILDQGDDFIIRSARDRVVAGPHNLVSEVLQDTSFAVSRWVWLSRRSGRRPPGSRKIHADRDKREARLSIRFGAASIQRPSRRPTSLRDEVQLHVVEVVEIDPPGDVQPVFWRLLTTLPVTTADQALEVVDFYRRRWLIEEFNKAFKTGCAVEQRQATNLWSLLNVIGLLLPVAVRLLQLRAMAHHEPTTPASEVLDEVELLTLNDLAPKHRLGSQPTLGAVLLAVAAIGGHLKSNGAPGWLVLGRGLQRLLDRVEGWRAALEWMRVRATQESSEM